MKKVIKIVSILLVLVLGLSLCACEKQPAAPTEKEPEYVAVDMSVACMAGPTGIGMAKLMSDAADGTTANRYTFTVGETADAFLGKVISGDINIAAVPTNVAVKAYNKTEGKIRMLAVNTFGALTLLENGETVKSIADLKGKTVYATGKGQNPEYIVNYILNKNGLDPAKDVTVVFTTPDEVTTALVGGKTDFAILPEPKATAAVTQKNTLRRAINLTDEWDKVSDSKLMMGCVIARDSYVQENPDAVEKFLEEYQASIEYANANPEEAGVMCEEGKIIPKAKIATACIPNSRLTYVDGAEMKADIAGYFEVLYNADPTSVGGKLPGEDFYYNAK